MFESILSFFKKSTIFTFVVIIGIILANGTFGTIGAGQRGILLRFGAVTDTVYNEGLYFKVPFIESVKVIDVKVQKEQTEATSASKDLQAVHAVVALNFHIVPAQVGKIYQGIGIDYKDKLIDPAIQESVKASTAKFTAEELISKREVVRAEMKKLLTEKLSGWGINVDDVNIVNFNFSDSFNAAIESKVTAEQDALASKNKLERIKFEAEQKIVEAKGKAEAMRVESEALKSNPEVLQLRALEKWNGILPQVTGGNIPFVNITGLGK